MPRAPAAIAIYYVVASAEASSNLARFDAVRYGPRPAATDLASLYVESRTAGFGPEVKRRILLGTFALAAGYYEAYYGRAMRARAASLGRLRTRVRRGGRHRVPLDSVSGIPYRGEDRRSPDDVPLRHLHGSGIARGTSRGLAALGLSKEGLPLGVQILGPRFGEENVFAAAGALEREVALPDELPRGIR